MKKLIALALMAALCCLASPALAQKKIRVAVDANWPPMEFMENGAMVGYSIDLMKAAAEAAGFEVEQTKEPWDGIFTRLMNGDYDAICSSVSITEERQKNMDFSQPYYTVKQAILVPVASDATSLADLAGKSAGSQTNTTGTQAINAAGGLESVEYDELDEAVEDLVKGGVDAVVCDDAPAGYFTGPNGKYHGVLKVAGTIEVPGETEEYGVAVRKGDTETLDLINKGLAAVRENGKEAELKAKWIGAN